MYTQGNFVPFYKDNTIYYNSNSLTVLKVNYSIFMLQFHPDLF